MSTKATIENGMVTNVRPSAEAGESDVNVGAHIRIGDTTPDNGVTWFRNGEPLVDPGYLIPVGEVFKELTSDELKTVLGNAFPGLTAQQMGVFEFIVRALAQTDLSSIDPRVIGARQQFSAVLGAERIAYLFRPR